MVKVTFKIILALLLVIPMGIGIFLFLKNAVLSLKDEVRSLKR